MSEKTKELMSKMSFEEKVLFLTGYAALSTAHNNRLGIENIEMSDGPHGVRRLIGHDKFPQETNIEGGDTCFPTASAVASSWNSDIAFEAGKHIAIDCHEEGIDLLLAPAVNMKRTPLCGRNFEYYSEDPVLAGEMAAAFIKGVQSEGVGTSLKHFAANNQELNRGSISVDIDEQTLREYYLEAFRIAIEKGKPETLMCAYNKLGGIWCSENKWLLTELLKQEWGYDGLIISDWGAVHSSSKAVAAGMDLEMPCNADICKDIKQGIKDGIISEDDVDYHCERVLDYIFHRQDKRKKNAEYSRSEQHMAAYKSACECITLLRNENEILPVKPEKYKKIALFGTMAEKPLYMGGGSSQVSVDETLVDKPLDFIKEHCCSKTELIYEPLYGGEIGIVKKKKRIEEISKEADLAIVFAGSEILNEAEETDRKRLTFPEEVNDLIDEISVSFKNVVVVMQSGCCTTGTQWMNRVDGIIQMWLCGEGGGKAIADVLFGTVNPSGKLSETFVREIPTHMLNISKENGIRYSEGYNFGYRYYDRHPEKVWFPFGHGLSYTQFLYKDLNVVLTHKNNQELKATVSLKVENIGEFVGKEVVQIYVSPKNSMTDRPKKKLAGFTKVELKPGECKEIEIELDNHAFAYYNTWLHKWHIENGKYNVIAAASSADIRCLSEISFDDEHNYTVNEPSQAYVL